MRTLRSSLLVSFALASALGSACKKSDEAGKGAGSASAAGAGSAVVKAPDAGAGSGSAVATIDAGVAVDPGGPLTNPFFYAVTKDGKTMHFLGSIHIGVEPSRMPPVVWDAAKKAKSFAMETDTSDLFAQAKLLRRTDGKTLEQELGPELWKRLDEAIGKKIHGGLKTINEMKTIVAVAQLETLGLPPIDGKGIDLAFLEAAQKNKAKIVYLEELTAQHAVLEKWLDARMLKTGLDHLDELEAQHAQLVASYVAGDEAAMHAMDDEQKADWVEDGRDPAEFDQMTKDLLYDRNKAWIPALEELAAEGDAFICVGAAHLVGPGSVLELLAAKGYTVTRVTPPAEAPPLVKDRPDKSKSKTP